MKSAVIALFSKENHKCLFWGGIVALVILLILLLLAVLLVMAIPPNTSIFMYLTGEKSKLELIKLIGWGISGVIAILGVMALFYRAETLDKQNETVKEGYDKQAAASNEQNRIMGEQAAASNEQNKIIRDGQLQERIKAAGDRLSSAHASVRIASFNEFYYLAIIEPNLRGYSFNILCLHLRQTTKDKNYQKVEKDSETQKPTEIKPTEEVQSLLDILFKPIKDKFIFDGLVANLEGVYLQGANLHNANLQKANLQAANLQEANLQGANLQGAKINEVAKATMPLNWKNDVEKNEKGGTGVLLIDKEHKVIEYL